MATRVAVKPSTPAAAKTNAVEQCLLTALGSEFAVRDAAETDQVYYERVAKGIALVDDESWNKLTDSAQAWFNKAAEVMNGGAGELPAFPADGEVVKETKPAVATGDPAAPPAKEEKKDEKPAAKEEKPAATAAAKEEKKPVEKSASTLIREFICVNLEATPPEAVAYVKENKKEISLSTASTIIFDTKKTIEVLRSLNMLKEEA